MVAGANVCLALSVTFCTKWACSKKYNLLSHRGSTHSIDYPGYLEFFKQMVGISVLLTIGLWSFIWPPIFGVCFNFHTMIILSMLYQMLALCQLHPWLPQNDTKWLNNIIKSYINTVVFQLIKHFELFFSLFIFPFSLRD